jgi:hypothetical protein
MMNQVNKYRVFCDYMVMMPCNKIRNKVFPLLLLLAAFSGFCAFDGPVTLRIYPKEGAPGVDNQPYPPPSMVSYTFPVYINFGDTLPFVAKIFDQSDIWLQQFETDTAPITWTLLLDYPWSPGGVLTSDSGFRTSFIATIGCGACYVIATLKQEGPLVSDTILLGAFCGPNHLVIEASPDSTISLANDNPVRSLYFSCHHTIDSVYAIIRDIYGNYFFHSGQTIWQSRDTSIAEVAQGNAAIGEGIIRCKKYANTWIFAHDSISGSPMYDSVLVQCAAGPCPHIYHLQIVKDDSVPLEALTLYSGTSITLFAQAVRVDSAECVDVAAYWDVSGNLHLSPVTPDFQHSWTFSALDTGTGWIKIHVHSEYTMADSIRVTVVPATRANNQGDYPVLKIMLGNRSISVPRDTKTFSITGFDLMGRVLFKQEKQIAGYQLLQSNLGAARHSGIALFVISFYNAQGKGLAEEKFKSVSFR